MSIKVVAIGEDGTKTDVTEGVQALYDHCVSSMDWGSGFLTVEDARGIVEVAQACGFLVPESAAAEFEKYARHSAGESNGSSNIICAVCGEQVFYSTGYPWYKTSESKPQGWHHRDSEPAHTPVLWR